MSVDQYKKEIGMMNLEKLIQNREGISTKKFPIPDKELLFRYEQLYTGAVNDVMREFCLLEQALPGRIKPLREYRSVAGFAFTVKSAPNVKIKGEMEYRVQMLDEMQEDHFVVWDTSRDDKATLWGGVMTATAKGKKLKAACIDGGIRDTHQILKADFPVFYEYRISNGSLGRCLITHYQIPIKIGDVTIKPEMWCLAILMGFWSYPETLPMKCFCVQRKSVKMRKKFSVGYKMETAFRRLQQKVGIFN